MSPIYNVLRGVRVRSKRVQLSIGVRTLPDWRANSDTWPPQCLMEILVARLRWHAQALRQVSSSSAHAIRRLLPERRAMERCMTTGLGCDGRSVDIRVGRSVPQIRRYFFEVLHGLRVCLMPDEARAKRGDGGRSACNQALAFRKRLRLCSSEIARPVGETQAREGDPRARLFRAAAGAPRRSMRNANFTASDPISRVPATAVATIQSNDDSGTVWNAACRNGT